MGVGEGLGDGVGAGVGAGDGVGVGTAVGVAVGAWVWGLAVAAGADVNRAVAVSGESLAALEQAARRTSAKARAPTRRALPRLVFDC